MQDFPPQDFSPQHFESLSQEFHLVCTPEGQALWRDARAQAVLGLAAGDSLQGCVAPGAEEKLSALLQRAASGPLSGWELPLVLQGRAATVRFNAAPAGNTILLVGSRALEGEHSAMEEMAAAVGEVVGLNREVLRQKRELERKHQELVRLHGELEESHRGVLTLHSELDDKTAELRHTSEVRGRVVSTVSHEFRTPLHSILGLTELLLQGSDGTLNGEQDKQVRFIRTSAEELLHLANDVLDLSRMEAGKASLRSERFTLTELFSSLRGALRPLVPAEAPIALHFEAPQEDVPLETDRAKLSQVVRNLVSNALKFTERGEVRVSARRGADGSVVLSVRDTGIGIAEGDLERVFEEFAMVESPLQGKVKGTGLGLPISRQLAQLLGGDLTVESEVGVGSTFHFTFLPVHPEVQAMEGVVERSRTLDPARAPILVVEDDRKSLFIYEKYLALEGFQVLPARTIDEAREVLKRVRPSAVVLDIMLEGESSWQFLAELKGNPETHAIPVLVVTVTNRADKARALGADEFWLKPVDQEQLLRKLTVLTRSSTPRKVLLIDDDERARYLVRRQLEDTAFTLLEAQSGTEGVALAQTERPHVILLDFFLRTMTAFDVLDELKADPRTRPIPVIIVTSHTLDPEARGRLLEEAEAVISKEHLSRELALSRIRDALRKAGVGTVR